MEVPVEVCVQVEEQVKGVMHSSIKALKICPVPIPDHSFLVA